MSIFESVYSQKKRTDNFWREIVSDGSSFISRSAHFQNFLSFSYNGQPTKAYEVTLWDMALQ